MPLLVLLLVSVTAAALTYWAWRWLPGRADVHHDDTGMAARASALAPAMGLLALAAVAIGSLALVVERNTPLRRWDDHVERWAVERAGPLGTDVVRLITHLGDSITVMGVSAIVVVLLSLAKRPRWALFLVVVVVGQWVLANTMKLIVGRPRPELDPLVTTFSGNSFPSGHSTAAAATCLALALAVSAVVVRADRRVLVAVAVGLGVAVGSSRALLGVHWFTDVVAGLLLGWAWCLICLALLDPDRRRAPQQRARAVDTGRS